MSETSADRAALQITQDAINILFDWAKVNLPNEWQFIPDDDTQFQKAIARAKKLINWSDDPTLQPLQVLFDRIHLSQGQQEQYYWQVREIEDSQPTIPYPIREQPTETELDQFKASIRREIEQLNLDRSDWQNLSLLSLIIEKYGSFLSFTSEDIALADLVCSTAAVAAALVDNSQGTHLSLIAGDLSGIQNFIYTISSDGALKSLRARSFYLELVTEEVVQQLLNALQLPRTNVIYAGGGNLYILAAATEENQKAIIDVREQLNRWLLKEFQGKVFLALDSHNFSIEDIASDRFADRWTEATKKLAVKKAQKFANEIGDLLQQENAYEPCKVCHRDNVKNLKPLNQLDDNSPLACGTCRLMFQLGRELFKVSAIVRSQEEIKAGERLQISFKFPETKFRSSQNIYYYLFEEWKQIFPDSETVLLVNDWTIEHYKFSHFRNPILLLLGNYGQQTQIPGEKGFISASELADKSEGIERVGYLRMDVDNLGQIFARGLRQQEKQTLPRIAGLSRQMSYFFKVYLNSLAEQRHNNFPADDKYQKIELSGNKKRDNLLFIYAGGDDLFVSGSWNEVVEFGFDVYQCFRAYTGHHPDITLSAGIRLEVAKFPLYQAAARSGEAEEAAKGNGRDSLGLFGQVFKWDEWLGNNNFQVIDREIQDYLSSETKPSKFGIYPFVRELKQSIDINYSRSFIRNLLTTAEIQEQKLKEAKNESEEHRRDLRYFLHLPKIAYTLARLPKEVRDKESFAPINTSLKNPWNANYFRAIATWIELLNRNKNDDNNHDK